MLIVVPALFMSSCATIFSGSKQKIKINSTPSEAIVVIDSAEVGKTPFQTKLKRNKKHLVQIELEGYQPYEVTLTRKFNAWYLGNILIGGAVGIIVDSVTGAMFYLSPKEIEAELQSGTVLKKDKGGEIYIGVALTPNPEWQQIGQLTLK